MVTGGLRDPRDRRSRDFGPAFGLGRRFPRARRSTPLDLFGGRSIWIALVVLVPIFVVIALGSSGPAEDGATEQDLLATVQGSMVQAGLPTVKVRVVDWMVILEGRVATSELKEAAERVAFAQADVISVQNRLYVPPPVVDTVTTTTAPDLPAALADLVLQSRLSTVAAHPSIQAQIIGHTDSDEKVPGDNLLLSAIRAEAVRTQLLARGVEPERLVTLGMGHTDPIADNITKTGKAANRRIEFLLLREGEVGLPAPAEPTGDRSTEADAGD